MGTITRRGRQNGSLARASQRVVSALLIGLFVLAGFAQAGPAFCCLFPSSMADAAPSHCCQSNGEQEQPAKHPQEDRECPKGCCAFTPDNAVTPAPVRPPLQELPGSANVRGEATDLTILGPCANLTGHRDYRPPPLHNKTSLHLRLQVIVR